MSSRHNTPIDQPSETIWCTFSSSTCSSAARRSSCARSSGPASRSKGWRASVSMIWRMRASRSSGDIALKSWTGSTSSCGGPIRCTGCVFTQRKVRAQRFVAFDQHLNTAPQRFSIQHTAQAPHRGDVVGGLVGQQPVQKPQPLLGKRQRQSDLCAVPAQWIGILVYLPHPASSATLPQEPIRSPSRRSAAAATPASGTCPDAQRPGRPAASGRPTRRSYRARRPARASRPRARLRRPTPRVHRVEPHTLARLVRSYCGAGSARRSILPLGVSGSSLQHHIRRWHHVIGQALAQEDAQQLDIGKRCFRTGTM